MRTYIFYRWERGSQKQERYFGPTKTWVPRFKKTTEYVMDEELARQIVENEIKEGDEEVGIWKVMTNVGGQLMTVVRPFEVSFVW